MTCFVPNFQVLPDMLSTWGCPQRFSLLVYSSSKQVPETPLKHQGAERGARGMKTIYSHRSPLDHQPARDENALARTPPIVDSAFGKTTAALHPLLHGSHPRTITWALTCFDVKIPSKGERDTQSRFRHRHHKPKSEKGPTAATVVAIHPSSSSCFFFFKVQVSVSKNRRMKKKRRDRECVCSSWAVL
ncbi:hypothetical protein DAPPUDRAFT_305351 [Daphnia pulex]|uniref:Uncharacterized protein n=1 Tax=Daphnia pulex TaxID=6669 RepID=E9GS52_DAPPU|nr:hypothetical protein DAPPUDRAFT_305351 [Daphnia pulex]|eukprot:EFX77650.1 hypothetical protein DAPPUDRAFT_305351 [Daphnia pulex]